MRARRAVPYEIPSKFRRAANLPTVVLFGDNDDMRHLLRIAEPRDDARFVIAATKRVGFMDQDRLAFAKSGIVYDAGNDRFLDVTFTDRLPLHYGFRRHDLRSNFERMGIPVSVTRNAYALLNDKRLQSIAFVHDGVPVPDSLYYAFHLRALNRAVNRATRWRMDDKVRPVVTLQVEDGNTARVCRLRKGNGDRKEDGVRADLSLTNWREAVFKPARGCGGDHVEFVPLGNGHPIPKLTPYWDRDLVVQERLEPASASFGIDFNVRAYGGVNAWNEPICYPDFILRVGKYGSPTNHSRGAIPAPFEYLGWGLGFRQDEMDYVRSWLLHHVPLAMRTILRHAAPSSAGVPNQIDFTSFDVMVVRTRDGLTCQFLEENDDASGGLSALSVMSDDSVAKGIIETMARRANEHFYGI